MLGTNKRGINDMKKLLFVLGLTILASKAQAQNLDVWGNQGVTVPSAVIVSSAGLGAIASSATATSGMYNMLTNIHIEEYSTGTVAGAANPYICISSNIPSTPTFSFPSALAVGTSIVLDMQFANPLKSVTANNITSVTCNSSAGIRWNVILGSFPSN